MKEIKINIPLTEVHTEVRKVTGYIGSKASQDGTLYQRMAVQDEDIDVISTYLKEASDKVSEVFYIYLGGMDIEGDWLDGLLTYTLNMTSNWEDLRDEVKQGVMNYYVHTAVSRWLETTEGGEAKNLAKSYQEKSVSDLDLLRKLCNRRVRPQKPTTYWNHNNEQEWYESAQDYTSPGS